MISPYRTHPQATAPFEVHLHRSAEYWVRVIAAGITVVLGLFVPLALFRSSGGWPGLLILVPALLAFLAAAARVLVNVPRDRHGSWVSLDDGALVVRTEGRTERVPFAKLRLVLDRRRGRLTFDQAQRVSLTLATHRRADLRVLQGRLQQMSGTTMGIAAGPPVERAPVSGEEVEIFLRRPSLAWALPGFIGVSLAALFLVRGVPSGAVVMLVLFSGISWVVWRPRSRHLPQSLRVSPVGLSVTARDGSVAFLPREHLRPHLTAGVLHFPAAGCSVRADQLESPSKWPAFLDALNECVGHDVRALPPDTRPGGS